MENKNERFANQIIRKFHGLEVRPEISKETQMVLDNVMSVDKTREIDKSKQKEEPLDK